MSKSLTEEFKDQKINDLLEDYIALENKIDDVSSRIIQAIEETPSRFDGALSNKLDQIIQDSLQIDKEIDNAKNDIKEISKKCKSDISEHVFNTLSGIKNDFNIVIKGYQEQLSKVLDSAKPFNANKAIAICVGCTVFISAALSSSFWFIAQSQKQNELEFYAIGYVDMRKLMLKTIEKLPKNQQESTRVELLSLENRKK